MTTLLTTCSKWFSKYQHGHTNGQTVPIILTKNLLLVSDKITSKQHTKLVIHNFENILFLKNFTIFIFYFGVFILYLFLDP